jgi:hypothetical protein
VSKAVAVRAVEARAVIASMVLGEMRFVWI